MLDLPAARSFDQDLDNATAVDYINHQGGTRSHAAQREANLILAWAELHILTLTAMHILSVEHFQQTFLVFSVWRCFEFSEGEGLVAMIKDSHAFMVDAPVTR